MEKVVFVVFEKGLETQHLCGSLLQHSSQLGLPLFAHGFREDGPRKAIGDPDSSPSQIPELRTILGELGVDAVCHRVDTIQRCILEPHQILVVSVKNSWNATKLTPEKPPRQQLSVVLLAKRRPQRLSRRK